MAANSAQNDLDLAKVKRENDNGDVIILDDDSETVAMPNITSNDNLSQQSTQEHVEFTTKIETNGPIEQAITLPVIKPEDNEVPSLPNTEPSVNISTVTLVPDFSPGTFKFLE
ncbi:hypothetical protein DdX_19095 [Ditylenchus destructor]|uniref:Uncharacterized protein n=1 Tax=Ditylenchus destructor TaxID=166010 RepID=A0AAD4MID3_9BILA|nr:hypothetical protein DdX_19095 [Ditylenchus destructor]